MNMTEKDAVERAKAIAESEGWPWIEPVRANGFRRLFSGEKRWRVTSNCRNRGMNVRIVLRDVDGSVLEKGFLPR